MNTRLLLPMATAALAACGPTITTARPTPPQGQAPGNSESVHVLGIPPGQLPRQGQCRVWIPGLPPGRQARSRSCRGILDSAPAGSLVVYRERGGRAVHVHDVHATRAGVVALVRFYNRDLRWVRNEEPDNHRHDDLEDDDRDRGRGRRP